jgi:hypothetical protein
MVLWTYLAFWMQCTPRPRFKKHQWDTWDACLSSQVADILNLAMTKFTQQQQQQQHAGTQSFQDKIIQFAAALSARLRRGLVL